MKGAEIRTTQPLCFSKRFLSGFRGSCCSLLFRLVLSYLSGAAAFQSDATAVSQWNLPPGSLPIWKRSLPWLKNVNSVA